MWKRRSFCSWALETRGWSTEVVLGAHKIHIAGVPAGPPIVMCELHRVKFHWPERIPGHTPLLQPWHRILVCLVYVIYRKVVIALQRILKLGEPVRVPGVNWRDFSRRYLLWYRHHVIREVHTYLRKRCPCRRILSAVDTFNVGGDIILSNRVPQRLP